MRRALLVAGALVAASCPVAWAGDRFRIVIEAEHYSEIKEPMAVSADEKASGGKCVTTPDERPSGPKGDIPPGEVVYRIRVPEAGDYWIWARLWFTSGSRNSIWVMVDTDSLDRRTPVIWRSKYREWHWGRLPQTLALTAGEHTVRFHRREDAVRLDQFLLTNDLRWTPVKPHPETPEFLIRDPVP